MHQKDENSQLHATISIVDIAYCACQFDKSERQDLFYDERSAPFGGKKVNTQTEITVEPIYESRLSLRTVIRRAINEAGSPSLDVLPTFV